MSIIKTLKGILFNPKQYWLPKIDIIILVLWLGFFQIVGELYLGFLLISIPGCVIVVFNLTVANLIPNCGFWYHHAFDE